MGPDIFKILVPWTQINFVKCYSLGFKKERKRKLSKWQFSSIFISDMYCKDKSNPYSMIWMPEICLIFFFLFLSNFLVFLLSLLIQVYKKLFSLWLGNTELMFLVACRLKSVCEEGQQETMNEQLKVLQNKVCMKFIYFSYFGILGRYCSLLQVLLTPLTNMQLLEALDWKLMHEADSSVLEVLNFFFFFFLSFIMILRWVNFEKNFSKSRF